jgi:hypothetical protein
MAMAIRRKPTSVEQFIQAGGVESASTSEKETPGKVIAIQPVKLRLEAELLEQVDHAVSARKPAPSRHQWILEAIYEKLNRDSNPNQA